MGAPLTHPGHLTLHPWEDIPIALHLDPGFDDILDRNDPDFITWVGQVNLTLMDTGIIKDRLPELTLIDLKGPVGKPRGFAKFDAADSNQSKFKLHVANPLF